MRVKDLVEKSNYLSSLRSEILNLLIAANAEGVDEIKPQNLLLDLQRQGFSVDRDSLLDILSSIDIVSLATKDTIKFSTNDSDLMVGKDAERIKKDRVDKLATKKATKSLSKESVNEGRNLKTHKSISQRNKK